MDLDKLRKLLKDKGYSVTGPRLTVFDGLQKLNKPVSTAVLADSLPEINRASVYRTVELFDTAGIIHRVWTGFKNQIELSEEFSPHHHHFTCIKCGKVLSLHSDELENSLKKLEIDNKFELTGHSIELSGYCENCRTNKYISGVWYP